MRVIRTFDERRAWHRARNHRVAIARIREDGRRAGALGLSEADCPYTTNTAGFRLAWLAGLREVTVPAQRRA